MEGLWSWGLGLVWPVWSAICEFGRWGSGAGGPGLGGWVEEKLWLERDCSALDAAAFCSSPAASRPLGVVLVEKVTDWGLGRHPIPWRTKAYWEKRLLCDGEEEVMWE